MPPSLEIAAAQKNVIDMRYRRALAQVELKRRQTKKGLNKEARENPPQDSAETKEKKGRKKEKLAANAKRADQKATASYRKFKKTIKAGETGGEKAALKTDQTEGAA